MKDRPGITHMEIMTNAVVAISETRRRPTFASRENYKSARGATVPQFSSRERVRIAQGERAALNLSTKRHSLVAAGKMLLSGLLFSALLLLVALHRRNGDHFFFALADVPLEQMACASCLAYIETKEERFERILKRDGTEIVFDAGSCEEIYCKPPTKIMKTTMKNHPRANTNGKKQELQEVNQAAQQEQPYVDFRVTKGYGSKDYNQVRISVITKKGQVVQIEEGNKTTPCGSRNINEVDDDKQNRVELSSAATSCASSAARTYSAPFQWVWKDLQLNTKMVRTAEPGTLQTVTLTNATTVVREQHDQSGQHAAATAGKDIQDKISAATRPTSSSSKLDKSRADVTSKSNTRPELLSTHFQYLLPRQGQPVSGVLIGDPCVQSGSGRVQPVPCAEGGAWDLWNQFPKLLELFVGNDFNVNFWGLLGDNFYDKSGEITQEIYQEIPRSVKQKLFLSVLGNHDYWVQGAPVRATPSDQCGNGFVQFYGQDTKSSLGRVVKSEHQHQEAPYDLSIDPSQSPEGQPGKCSYTAKENTFFYNQIGNIGFIGYSAVHSWEDMKHDFATACDAFWATDSVDLVFVLGHWNKEGAGTSAQMDLLNVTAKLMASDSDEDANAKNSDSSLLASCAKFHAEGRLTFAMGHEHCSHPVVNNYVATRTTSTEGRTTGGTRTSSANGSEDDHPPTVADRTGFLVGSFGMDDWVCPDPTKIGVASTATPTFGAASNYNMNNLLRRRGLHQSGTNHSSSVPGLQLASTTTSQDVDRSGEIRRTSDGDNVHTYGIPVFDTSNNMFTVWYFLLKSVDVDRYDVVESCLRMERTWKLCTHLATLWHQRPLLPRARKTADMSPPMVDEPGRVTGAGNRNRARADGRREENEEVYA
ncbi:unnamed protein product [Amoebophrya sp. A120]|nr:unnamed protein product [Amoebophrya sp. A120]|eukprot:GSA120T00005911001.1